MAATKKVHRNSIQGQLDAHRLVAEKPPLAWPQECELPPGHEQLAMEKFAQYQRARHPGHWQPHHGQMLAEVARLDVLIEMIHRKLGKDGPMQPSTNNPAVLVRSVSLDVLTMLQGSRANNLKTLGIAGRAAENDGVARGRNEASLVQRRAKDADSLLAGADDLLG